MSQRPEVKVVQVPVPQQEDTPPLWFQAALASLALFAGPILFAIVIGLVYLAAVVAGQTYALFRHSAGT